jgi:cobalt-zinc-cadmium efflux system membrane fusion protein
MNMFRICKLNILTATMAIVLLASQNTAKPEDEHENAHAGRHDEAIRLTDEQVKQANLSWGALEPKSIAPVLRLSGELHIHAEDRSLAGAISDGVLSDIRVRLNQPVKKGALVAVLRKPDLIDLQQQYLENRDRLVFLKAEKERYAGLKEENATSLKNYQKALAEFQAATTLGQTLATKLNLLGINPAILTAENLFAELQVYAPISGTVTAVNASKGMAVAAGQGICEIVDFSALHADLFVFEKDALNLKVGQTANIHFPGADGAAAKAQIVSVDRVLDKEKNALRANAKWVAGAGLAPMDCSLRQI